MCLVMLLLIIESKNLKIIGGNKKFFVNKIRYFYNLLSRKIRFY